MRTLLQRGGSKAELLHRIIRFLPQKEMKFTFNVARLPKKTLRQTVYRYSALFIRYGCSVKVRAYRIHR